MSYRRAWIPIIQRGARRRGLDPQAVLAVASAEGLSGGVGDNGHAFGPFQLNDAGGVITGRPGNHRAFAESPQGIEWALDQIAGVAKGKRGRAAIEAIVRQFERPAAPNAEIARAWSSYGKFGGGSEAPAVGAPPAPPGQQPPSAPDYSRVNQGALAQIASGGKLDFVRLLGQQQQAAQQQMQPQAPSRLAQAAGAPPAAPSVGHGVAGKIIGTPYSGTHTLGNWESDNAVDESIPVGTPIRAPFDGVIGSQIGSLGSSNPRMQGLRVHVVGKNNEAYLAHLSKLTVHAGQRVRRGQIIGYSGSAAGVPHLHESVRRGDPRSIVPLT